MTTINKYLISLATFLLVLLHLPKVLGSEIFITPNFKITINRNCPEGNISCNNVTYIGVNRKTGDSIKLKGKTVHTPCADGITPCKFLGYIFQNGNTKYYLRSNTLYVIQNGKTILEEEGQWKD